MKLLKALLAIAVLCAVLFLFVYFTSGNDFLHSIIINSSKDYVKRDGDKITVIIDAGHGGIDGGAVAYNGVLEKDMNLDYAVSLEKLLTDRGISVIMTRSSDVLLSDAGKNRKMRDLKARLEIAEKEQNCIFVSIHMNKFSDPSVRGTTVYYSENHKDGKLIAKNIMEALSKEIESVGKRPIKPSGSSIYILERITKPAVLVECGFISNKEETDLLLSKEYKEKFLSALADVITEYIKKPENTVN